MLLSCDRRPVLKTTVAELMHLADLHTDGAVLQELGHRLERLRLARNFSQAQLGRMAGVSRATVVRVEAGESVQMSYDGQAAADAGPAQGSARRRRAGGQSSCRSRDSTASAVATASACTAAGRAPAPPRGARSGWTWDDPRRSRADDRRSGDAVGDGRIAAVTIGADRASPRSSTSRRSPAGVEVAPCSMPLREPYRFPGLPRTLHGLPGLLADALPDRWGNALIDAWLAAQGRDGPSFDAVERLCYIGTRGMGALEFQPGDGPESAAPRGTAARRAGAARRARCSTQREASSPSSPSEPDEEAMLEILASARPPAARGQGDDRLNADDRQVRSGQIDAGAGLRVLAAEVRRRRRPATRPRRPAGMGRRRVRLLQMASAAGIAMTECRLLEEKAAATS